MNHNSKNKPLIRIGFQMKRDYSKYLNIFKGMTEMQDVKEPLMGTVAEYALDAEQDYLAASDAFYDMDFNAGPADEGRKEENYER